MTRGEAPGGSRPGAFGAIRLRRMDGGIATAPLGGSAHPPSAHGLTGGAQQAGGQPPAPFMGLAGGCPRARDGENSASLIFLALPRSACPRFWARAFLHYHPIWMGVIMWL